MADQERSLAQRLAEQVSRERGAVDGLAQRVREYADWAGTAARQALERAKAEILTADSDAQVVVDRGEGVYPPQPSIHVHVPGQPDFDYYLSLHENTGSRRAFVLKDRTIYDADAMTGPGTKRERVGLFNEHYDGRWNDAEAISEDDVYNDVMMDYVAHRHAWGNR